MATVRTRPALTATDGGNEGATPKASSTSPYHSTAHRPAAAHRSQGGGGVSGSGRGASTSRRGPNAMEVRPTMAAPEIRTAPAGGLNTGTWKTLGLANRVHEYHASQHPRKNNETTTMS